MKHQKSIYNRFTGANGNRRCLEALKEQLVVQGSEPIARAFCKNRELRYYKAGKTIIKQGDGTNDLAFILLGKVAVVRNNREIAQRSAGECVGEMAVIDVQQKRSASIVAKEDCIVALVPEADFTRIASKYPELWRRLVGQVADRLRQRLEGVRPRNIVPRVFIGSSTESKKAALAVKKSLDKVATTVVWTQKDVFEPGKFTLESLEENAQRSDFAVMVFGPDDIIFSRGNRQAGPRDNVIFELGLFMGALERKRAFVIAPRGKKLKIPTDILGTNFVTYPVGGNKSLDRAIDEACETLKNVIKKSGPI
ncbi:MAG: TIR domain-containing protein [Verrucomicrobiota bacterium]|jgi:predicted nucleotide-binding protein